MSENEIKIPACPYCKSSEIYKDAWAEYDPIKQDWVVSALFDDLYCTKCEKNLSDFTWIEKENE